MGNFSRSIMIPTLSDAEAGPWSLPTLRRTSTPRAHPNVPERPRARSDHPSTPPERPRTPSSISDRGQNAPRAPTERSRTSPSTPEHAPSAPEHPRASPTGSRTHFERAPGAPERTAQLMEQVLGKVHWDVNSEYEYFHCLKIRIFHVFYSLWFNLLLRDVIIITLNAL